MEQAAQCLVAAGRKVFPKAFQLTFRWACESQPGCRQALDHALGGGACILHDILARCPVATEMFTRYKAQKIIDVPVKDLWQQLQEGGVTTDGGRCFRHSWGTCQTPRPVGDVSGSPCQLWSSFGKRGKHTSYLIILLMAWALWLRWCQVPVAIHENVLGFDVQFFKSLLGDMFCLVFLPVSPKHAGLHFVRRWRTYVVVWLRGHVQEAVDIKETYGQVVDAFIRRFPSPFPLSCVYIATETEVQEAEQMYAARRGGCIFKRQGGMPPF